jgi:hypothetical protein
MGAGLLANAVGQSASMCLKDCIREQARSHMGFWVSGRAVTQAAVCQLPEMLAGTPLSQASQLPQLIV